MLAREKTAAIWDARLSSDGGLKSAADHLLQASKPPPRRKTSRLAPADTCVDRDIVPPIESPRNKRHGFEAISGVPSPRKAEKVARSIRDVDEVVTRFEKAAATNAVDGISGIGEYIRDALGRVVVVDGLSRMRSLEGSGARMTKHLSLKPAGTHKRLRPPPIDLQIEWLWPSCGNCPLMSATKMTNVALEIDFFLIFCDYFCICVHQLPLCCLIAMVWP